MFSSLADKKFNVTHKSDLGFHFLLFCKVHVVCKSNQSDQMTKLFTVQNFIRISVNLDFCAWIHKGRQKKINFFGMIFHQGN